METEETFAELDRSELLALAKRRDGPGLVRLAVQLPWLIGSGVLLVLVDDPIAIVGALLLHGIAQATMFGPLHESVHRTAFATRWLNVAVCWIAGFVQLSGPAGMRAFHFAHHRHTHDLEHDPELGGMELLAAWPSGVLWLVNASGLPILLGRASWMLFSALGLPSDDLWGKVMPFVRPDERPGVTRHSRIMVAIHLAILAASWWAPELLRLYGGMVVGHALLSLYLVAEHRGLDREGDVLERTRTFAGNPVIDWLMWNMPYHAEHHAWPGVPFHALPELHERVADRLPHSGARLLALHLSGGRP